MRLLVISLLLSLISCQLANPSLTILPDTGFVQTNVLGTQTNGRVCLDPPPPLVAPSFALDTLLIRVTIPSFCQFVRGRVDRISTDVEGTVDCALVGDVLECRSTRLAWRAPENATAGYENDGGRVCIDSVYRMGASPVASVLPLNQAQVATLSSGGRPIASAEAPVSLSVPLLTLRKSANVTEVRVGDVVEYTVMVDHSELSTAPAAAVTVADYLPAGLLLDDRSVVTSGGNLDVAALAFNRLIVTVDALPGDGSVELRYAALVSSTVTGDAVNNVAIASWTDARVPERGTRTPEDRLSVPDNVYLPLSIPPTPAPTQPPPREYLAGLNECIAPGTLAQAVNTSRAGRPPAGAVACADAGVEMRLRDASVATECAEEDNVAIAVHALVRAETAEEGLSKLRQSAAGFDIVATHPLYHTSFVDAEANFTGCSFLDRRIISIGDATVPGNATGFAALADMRDGLDFFAETLIPSSVPEWAHPPCVELDKSPISAFPSELNSDWMRSFFVHLTTLDPLVHGASQTARGAIVRLGVADVYQGTDGSGLQVAASIYSDGAWQELGRQTFTSAFSQWSVLVPDYTWSSGCFANTLRFEVLTPVGNGAWMHLNHLSVLQRPDLGESPTTVYDDGTVAIDTVSIVWWWLAPATMQVSVRLDSVDGALVSQGDASYVRVTSRVLGRDSWLQSFVLYQDGYLRLKPHPDRAAQVDLPFGTSVVLGFAANPRTEPRPAAPITSVALAVRRGNVQTPVEGVIAWQDGTEASFVLHVAGEEAKVELRVLRWPDNLADIVTFDPNNRTLESPPLALLRSMYVEMSNADGDTLVDGNGMVWTMRGERDSEVDREDDAAIVLQGPADPAFLPWSPLRWSTDGGDTVFLTRQCPSTHNTESPDMQVTLACYPGATSEVTATTTNTPTTSMDVGGSVNDEVNTTTATEEGSTTATTTIDGVSATETLKGEEQSEARPIQEDGLTVETVAIIAGAAAIFLSMIGVLLGCLLRPKLPITSSPPPSSRGSRQTRATNRRRRAVPRDVERMPRRLEASPSAPTQVSGATSMSGDSSRSVRLNSSSQF